jgi:putative DNA methylase
LAAARAVIFAQMVDDPSAHPDLFPTEKKQEKERQRLFRIIENLVLWENTTNEQVLQQARDEIWQSWRRACAENADHPRAKELFDRKKLPAFHDPFAGGGALPLEAQRLGLESYASDLNPVAVLINKAMIEIPPKFAGKPPVNPEARKEKSLIAREWKGAQGLAEDVRYYGQWMRDEAEKRIGHLYPKVEVTAEMVKERPDLEKYVGKKLTVIAWLWARTVKSPNPAFAKVDVPLASTFMLSTKAGKEAYIEPVIENGGYRFTVKVGKPKDADGAKSGTKLSRGANFQCLMSATPIASDHIYGEAQAGRMGARLMAIVAEGDRGRVYLAPTPEMEEIALTVQPTWMPEGALPDDPRNFWTVDYGLKTFGNLFTPRQLVALTTFSDLVQEARERVQRDALAAGMRDNAPARYSGESRNPEPGQPLDPGFRRGDEDGGRCLATGGTGATAYADAVAVYLGFQVDQLSNHLSTVCAWHVNNEQLKNTFARQAIPMVWDFAETNPLSASTGSLANLQERQVKGLLSLAVDGTGSALQADVSVQAIGNDKVISTDPPYYDNIGYADLSDFFYVWMRRSLRPVFPDLFATLAVPKAEELVATPYRHGSKEKAEAFFLNGMTQAMHRLTQQAHPAFPVTIYYAFKQSETESAAGTASTGWETFLDAVIHAGFGISGTWPMRTENDSRMIGQGTNALASSIVLVCRPRAAGAVTATRREFVAVLKGPSNEERHRLRKELDLPNVPPKRKEEIRQRLEEGLPAALTRLQSGNIAPVDLAQAAIGPGMAIYTRYARVLDAEGKSLTVRDALALINQTLDEALAEQEGDFDADSRWALAWFEQSGFTEGEYGVAETLSKAKNTSVSGMVEAGILASSRGKVRLLKPDELPADWDPTTDPRLTAWEMVHQLIRSLEAGGEGAAAALVAKLGAKAEIARELAYRLYTLCERKKRAAEALAYNGLVQSWPEIARLARESGKPRTEQGELL